MSAAIPFYRSPQTIGLVTTFVAAAVALFPKAGTALGLTTPGAIETAVSNIAGVIALLAPIVGTIVRVKSTEQPITLTEAAAETHPATATAEAVAKVNAQNAHTASLVVAMQQRKANTVAPDLPAPVPVQPTPAPVFDATKPWGK